MDYREEAAKIYSTFKRKERTETTLKQLAVFLEQIAQESRREAFEEAAYQAEIFYGPGAGPNEAWRAAEKIAKAIRARAKEEKDDKNA